MSAISTKITKGALSEVGAIGAEMKTIQAEMQAAGFDVSSPSN